MRNRLTLTCVETNPEPCMHEMCILARLFIKNLHNIERQTKIERLLKSFTIKIRINR